MRNEFIFNKVIKGYEYERNGRDIGVVEGWNERNRSNINVLFIYLCMKFLKVKILNRNK